MQSINLFSPPPSFDQKENQPNVCKRDKFRHEIRRASINVTFENMRKNLIDELNSETVKRLVVTLEAQGFNQGDLRHMINILDENCNDAKFNIKFSDDRLEEVLINLLMKHSENLSLEEKCKIVSALDYLTYFCDSSRQNLAQREDFVDFLRKQIQMVRVDKLQHLCYFKVIVILLMNLSSILRQDFNLYLAESDISKNINLQICQTINLAKHTPDQNYHSTISSIREDILRLYKNIVNKIKGSVQVPVALLQNLLLDEMYLKEHKENVFLLLSEAMKKEDFWSCFRKSKHSQSILICVSEAMDSIQQRCFDKHFQNNITDVLTEQEYIQFYAMICFLNQLFGQDKFDQFDWFTLIETSFNGFMLAEFLLESIKKKDKRQEIAALCMYSHLSKTPEVTAEQLIIIRKANCPMELIKVFAGNEWLIVGSETGVYCTTILTNLLRKNPEYLKNILEQSIVDFLQNILTKQESQADLLCSSINLIREMIASDISLNTKQKSNILNVFDYRGILKKIEKLSDHSNREVYTKAELFTEFISDKRQ